MPDDNKISVNLPREGADFQGRLTSHQLGDRVETELPQSRHALPEHADESIFRLRDRSRVDAFSEPQATGIDDDG